MNPNPKTNTCIHIPIGPSGEGVTLDPRLTLVAMSGYKQHHYSGDKMGRGGAYSGGGRGEYYKQKYGGGRGRRGNQGNATQGGPMITRSSKVII